MQKFKKITAAFFALFLCLSSFIGCGKTGDSPVTEDTQDAETTAPMTEETTAEPESEEQTQIQRPEGLPEMNKDAYSTRNYENVKAMWLSQFDLTDVYSSSGAQRTETQYRTMIKKVLRNVSDNGYNTVIVQVRPNADSMYPSDFYPMSYYVVGTYGKEAAYDPFSILIEEAHALELSVHAWINPLRGMSETNVKRIPDRYEIRRWYSDVQTRGKKLVILNGNCYLNPAYEDVRQLIINGAYEIAMKYNVDGLHMDDYFYPTQDASFDSAAYTAYKKDGGKLSLADFRRDCLNRLVSGLYEAVKFAGKDILFGISPAGVIDTVYNKQYADVYTWCANSGYIDYICPQVYFGLEHQTCDFVKICNVWRDIIKVDSVDLIIGMTLGKAKSKYDQYAGSGKNEWAEHDDILLRCLTYTEGLDKCIGVSYFCYQYFYNPVSGVSVAETLKERNNFLPLLKTIEWKNGK